MLDAMTIKDVLRKHSGTDDVLLCSARCTGWAARGTLGFRAIAWAGDKVCAYRLWQSGGHVAVEGGGRRSQQLLGCKGEAHGRERIHDRA